MSSTRLRHLTLALAFVGGACGPTDTAGAPGATGAAEVLGGGLVLLGTEGLERPFYRNFGELDYGATEEWVIRMRNDDPGPLTIRSAQGACGCTKLKRLTAYVTDEEPQHAALGDTRDLLVVPAGAEAELVIGISTERIQANKHKLAVFRLSTDSAATPFLTFEASLFARRSFTLSPAEARFGDVASSYGGQTKVRIITGVPGSRARVLSIAEQGERVTAELEELFVGGEYVWHVLVTLPPFASKGALRDQVVLATTDSEGEGDAGRVRLPVLAQIHDDVLVLPRLLALGGFDATAGAERPAELRVLVPGQRVTVTGHRFEGTGTDHLSLEAEPLAADVDGRATHWRLVLRAAPGTPIGPMAGKVVLTLDDAQTPELVVPYSGMAR